MHEVVKARHCNMEEDGNGNGREEIWRKLNISKALIRESYVSPKMEDREGWEKYAGPDFSNQNFKRKEKIEAPKLPADEMVWGGKL